MPSNAYAEFKKNLTDVHRLITAHRSASGQLPGKRKLGHYTRGGLVLLCAAWERYIELVFEESVSWLSLTHLSFNQLPFHVKNKITDYVNSNKNTWQAVDLTTPRWGEIYIEVLKKQTSALNTPKYEQINKIFNSLISNSDIALAWSGGSRDLNDFVSLRGDVAHRGRESEYIHFGKLKKAEITIANYVLQTDNYLSDCLNSLVTPNRRPWNRKN